jgi:hypothetical protein
VAIVDGDFRPAELRGLRALHVGRWTSALIHYTALRRRWPTVCNGIYLKAGDLSHSPLELTPLAGHVTGRFRLAPSEGFDVNPVTWHVLAHHGVALRGPDRDRLQIFADDAELRAWVLANLNSYWRRWVSRVRPVGQGIRGVPPRRLAATGVLGAPRLHYTIATGDIATKQAAARYALEAFDPRWHGLIEEAIADWRGDQPSQPYRRHPHRRDRDAVEFARCVIDPANRLTPTHPHADVLPGDAPARALSSHLPLRCCPPGNAAVRGVASTARAAGSKPVSRLMLAAVSYLSIAICADPWRRSVNRQG